MRRRALLFLPLLVASACGGEEPTDGGTGGGGTPPLSHCGDGARTGAELCDGRDTGLSTCESEGFGPGALGCLPDCRGLDFTGCGASAACGNGRLDGSEPCDGAELGGESCSSLGLGDGQLGCNAGCTGLDFAGCAGVESCGDGALQLPEVCDGDELGGQSCAGRGFDGGELRCAAGCLGFDTGGCTSACTAECGGRQCGVDPVCGLSCGVCASDELCNADGLCELAPACRETTDLCAGTGCVFNVEPDLVPVAGRVSFGGVVIPDAYGDVSEPDWCLVFIEQASRYEYTVCFNGGRGAYTTKMYPGTYDVDFYLRYVSEVTDGIEGRKRLVNAFVANGTNPLNVEPDLVPVAGRVSFGGAVIPDAYGDVSEPDWCLVFIEQASRYEYTVCFNGGRGAYTTKMYPGTYDVDFYLRYVSEVTDGISGRKRLVNAFVADGVNPLNVEPDLVPVAGRVSFGGAVIPDAYGDVSEPDWCLVFIEQASRYEYTVCFNGGRGAYTTQMYPGTYDVDFYLRYVSEVTDGISGRKRLVNAFVADGVNPLNVEPDLVAVAGRVSFGGAVIPDAYGDVSEPDWCLVFIEQASRYEYTVCFNGGRGAYTTKMYPGTYDVDFYLRYVSEVTDGIEGRKRLVNAFVADGVNPLNVEPDLVPVAGRVSFGGAVIPDAYGDVSEPDWCLVFIEQASRYEVTVCFNGGRGAYTTKMFPGTYDVDFYLRYVSEVTDGISGRKRLVNAFVADGVNPLNVEPALVPVGGRVSFGGVVIPDAYGDVSEPDWCLVFIEQESLYEYTVCFNGGRGAYTTKMFPGTYDVDFYLRYVSEVTDGISGRKRLADCVELH